MVTNHYVRPDLIGRAKKESLAVFSGFGSQSKVYPARIVKTDPDHDLVLLEITNGPLPAKSLAPETTIREGGSDSFYRFSHRDGIGAIPGYPSRNHLYHCTHSHTVQ